MPRRIAKKVVKAEDKQSHDYEMVLIISPELAEEKLDAAINNVSQFITERGGTVANVERWGKRKLAYPIGHFVEGSYVLTRFSMKPTLGRELEANLKISEEVLRHLLVKVGS